MGTNRREFEEPLEYKIIIFSNAQQDIIEIVKWYDLQAEGLKEKFLVNLREAINKLRMYPSAFGFAFKDVSKIQLNIFPYSFF